MLQLTYISTATGTMSDVDVSTILSVSRLNNAAAGVTGLLLYDGRRFLQALEGEAAMVDRTFQRIKADKRHRAVVLLSSGEATERSFGNWAMAAERASAGHRGNNVAELVDTLTETVADPNVRALFRSFARVRDAA